MRQLAQASQTMVRRLPEFRAATARLNNRAVFECPEVFADLMRASAGPAGPAASAASAVSAASVAGVAGVAAHDLAEVVAS